MDMAPVTIGRHCQVDRNASIGRQTSDEGEQRTRIGDDATIRSGTVIYEDVEIGNEFSTGHNVVVRDATTIGDNVLLGTNTVVDGACTIGSDLSCQTNVYIPRESTIGDSVFLGPCAVLTNDQYPIRTDEGLAGPTLEDNVTIGANATVLPDVTVGQGAFVAAGATVTEDVPPETLAVGSPANHEPLPAPLEGGNEI
jgi:acetyltransferase-like isoleucine patch superfamily enzyme